MAVLDRGAGGDRLGDRTDPSAVPHGQPRTDTLTRGPGLLFIASALAFAIVAGGKTDRVT